jgi:hypothetical protein
MLSLVLPKDTIHHEEACARRIAFGDGGVSGEVVSKPSDQRGEGIAGGRRLTTLSDLRGCGGSLGREGGERERGWCRALGRWAALGGGQAGGGRPGQAASMHEAWRMKGGGGAKKCSTTS